MPSVPPALEAIARALLPPACREEVLGDLCETYTGPGQYILLALRTVPFVIVSRIRRTTDTYVLLTEALLIYGSYLAAAWYTDRTLLIGHWGLAQLLIPTALQLAVLILDHVWSFETGWTMRLIQASLIGISAYLNITGCFASLLLVGAVETLFSRGKEMPEPATGPVLRIDSPMTSRITMSTLAAVVIGVVAILSSSRRLEILEIVVVIIVVILLPRLGKE